MTQTTLVFLKSFLSRDRFADALDWVKARERRIYLPDDKLWVLDLETDPTDPGFENALEEVRESGWTIVASTLWDASLPLRGNEKALSALSELAVEHQNRNIKRNPK
ncbi:MAG: hypothetical protein ABL984_00480 [Pyrinomonadaceae bacterium]